MIQLEMFEVTPYEIGLIEKVLAYRSVSVAAEELQINTQSLYQFGKRLCPHHVHGDIWKPYFAEYLYEYTASSFKE